MEIWKDVPNYEGLYQASECGKVKSLRRNIILSPSISKLGYARLVLVKGKYKKGFLVHRLVALSHIPNPDNKVFINHKNGKPLDNHINNLEWCTPQENSIHSFVCLNRQGTNKNKRYGQHTRSRKVQLIINNESLVFDSILRAAEHLNTHSSNLIYKLRSEKYPNYTYLT
jgi:hypothetical protein